MYNEKRDESSIDHVLCLRALNCHVQNAHCVRFGAKSRRVSTSVQAPAAPDSNIR